MPLLLLIELREKERVLCCVYLAGEKGKYSMHRKKMGELKKIK